MNSIAVLPFKNMSSDKEDEYFSDGITEEIINALCKFDGLDVISRTSSFAFKNKDTDIREIGKQLNINFILEGSVRRSGAMVRITAQLIKAEDGFHAWSQKWDRELKDIFILQDEIAQLIAESISLTITPASVSEQKTISNTHAFEYYLKGLQLLNSFDHHRANDIIGYFEQSIAIDSAFEKSYLGLCDAYTWLSSVGHVNPMEAHQKVEGYIAHLLTLNPNIPEVYNLVAGKNFWIEWDMHKALENINISLRLKPNFAEAYIYRGLIHIVLGCIDEAFASFFHAERLNPFDPITTYCIGYLYHLTDNNIKAQEFIEKNEKSADLWSAHYLAYVEILCKNGYFEKAWKVISEKETAPSLVSIVPYVKVLYSAYKGDIAKAKEQLLQVEEVIMDNLEQSAPFLPTISKLYLLTGLKDKALDYFEMAIKYRSTPILFALVDSTLDELRSEPRFQEAIDGLPFYLPAPNSSIETKKYRKATLNEKMIKDIKDKLTSVMEGRKPYLNPRLSSPELAELIHIPTNQLSQYLNEHLGKNFYDYVNAYRLKEFQSLKVNPKYEHLSILGLALESGFNSKTTFNSFFKREMGVTPSEFYRKSEE